MTASLENYLPLIKKTARHYRDIEDAEQEAWLCYCEALHDYDPAKCRYFASYLQQKLRWHFKKLIRAKHKQLRTHAACCQAISETRLTAASQNNLVDLPELQRQKLPPRTLLAVTLLRNGYSLSETARRMNVKPQTIAGLVKRALIIQKNISQPV